MEKKSEVLEHNFTEGKALHYLCSAIQCAKLSFMIKSCKKMKRSDGIEFFKFRIEKVRKMFFLNLWEPW